MKQLPTRLFITLGIVLVFFSVVILGFTFYPVALVEIQYRFNPPNPRAVAATASGAIPSGQPVILPVDENFGIVIPKIGANAKVVANVNPYDSRAYQTALTKGVAHAKGTVFPGEVGNIFIFSHSSANFYEAGRYNSIFYLLDKMENGDEIDLFYNKQKFTYKVKDKKIVEASAVPYLNPSGTKKVLTLMTCWPPGTTLKRLIVLAEAD